MSLSSIANKIALITGASRRLGRSISLALAREGVNLVLHYHHSEPEAKSLCREVEQLGVKCWILQADFQKSGEYETLMGQALTAAGAVDYLINNASVFWPDTLADLSFERLVKTMEINLWVPLCLSREFARQNRPGQIVNLLDTRIKAFDFQHAAYGLSKKMLADFTRHLALEYAPRIQVNGIAPGLILPPAGESEGYFERLLATVPLHRHGDPDDIARTVVYLLHSDFITGEIIHVDGGRHLRGNTHG